MRNCLQKFFCVTVIMTLFYSSSVYSDIAPLQPSIIVEDVLSNLDLTHLLPGDQVYVYLSLTNQSDTTAAKKVSIDVECADGIFLKKRPPKFYRLKPREHRHVKLSFIVAHNINAGHYPIRIIPHAKNQDLLAPLELRFDVLGPRYNLRYTFWGGTYWPTTNEIIFKCGVVNEGPNTSDQFRILAQFDKLQWEGPYVQKLNPGEEMIYGPFHINIANPMNSVMPIQLTIVSAMDSSTSDNVVTDSVTLTDQSAQFGFGYDK
ncbi:MAG: hypothetical protein Q8Q33_01250 [Chlamydiota bacterium]|nr:hypothetical protein [Chlamydiota bacterium]